MLAQLPQQVDSIYLGGGTPSLLKHEQVCRLFQVLRSHFDVANGAEITLECAPGQLTDETLEGMQLAGVNRVSLGVQSFVDAEARAVGRLHTSEICLAEIDRLRAAGVSNLNVDLIAGLPGQTAESWCQSLEAAIHTGVPHVSVYMLELDEDSRLGREVLAAGDRYGASAVPEEDAIAAAYSAACEWLESAGLGQYEISNFARQGGQSIHNLKYWQRRPYVGFGLDAHSMLRSGAETVRFANPCELDSYLDSFNKVGTKSALQVLTPLPEFTRIAREQQFEESLFLGLRLNEGVPLANLRSEFGELADGLRQSLADVIEADLLRCEDNTLRLTHDGRIASNEVFSRLLVAHS